MDQSNREFVLVLCYIFPMYLNFDYEFQKKPSEIYQYFCTPKDWQNLFPFPKHSRPLKNDWYHIPLKGSPVGLRAKNIINVPNQQVRWIFEGFWRGVGEVTFEPLGNTNTRVRGFEYVSAHALWMLGPFAEKHFLEKEFSRIWNNGWKRLATL